jgi:hypothetical protein
MSRENLITRLVDRKLAKGKKDCPFCICMAGQPRGEDGQASSKK